MAFVLHVFIAIPCLLEYGVTYFNEVYSLNEYEAEETKFDFSIAAGSIWFAFWF